MSKINLKTNTLFFMVMTSGKCEKNHGNVNIKSTRIFLAAISGLTVYDEKSELCLKNS